VEHPLTHIKFPTLQTTLPVLLLSDLDPAWPQADIGLALEVGEVLTKAIQAAGHSVVLTHLQDGNLADLLGEFNPHEMVVFNWCEDVPGIPRSSWMVARELERQGFTFTGADSPSLVLSQDKRQVQQRLKEACIPTPIWRVFDSASQVNWHLFPAIVKPAFEHCGLGIERESVVLSHAELVRRVGYVVETFQQPVLVEEFIDGREFHVGVVGNRDPQMLPPAEIDFSIFDDIHDRLCSYDANFNPASLAYQNTWARLPVEFSPEDLHRMKQAVVGAYRATSCRDYARMDLRMRDGIFYILDVNHNADICPENSLIRAAELVGYPYGQFGSLLVNLAAERHPVFGNGAC